MDAMREVVYIVRIQVFMSNGEENQGPLARRDAFIGTIGNIGMIIGMFSGLENVCFFMKDRESRFMGANTLELEKMGVATEADVIGKSDYDFFPRHMIALYHADDQRVMETGEPIQRRIEPVSNPDGSVSWHVTSKFPLLDLEGRCVGLAGIMQDLDRGARSWRPHRRMSKVLDYIAEHYSEPLTIKTLAGVAGLSISQFDRRFRKALGWTPSRFLIRYRLTRASQLLVGGDFTIGRVAAESGFYDHSHFTREFRKMFGISPGRYRREHTG